jgi:hypothetical protein
MRHRLVLLLTAALLLGTATAEASDARMVEPTRTTLVASSLGIGLLGGVLVGAPVGVAGYGSWLSAGPCSDGHCGEGAPLMSLFMGGPAGVGLGVAGFGALGHGLARGRNTGSVLLAGGVSALAGVGFSMWAASTDSAMPALMGWATSLVITPVAVAVTGGTSGWKESPVALAPWVEEDRRGVMLGMTF